MASGEQSSQFLWIKTFSSSLRRCLPMKNIEKGPLTPGLQALFIFYLIHKCRENNKISFSIICLAILEKKKYWRNFSESKVCSVQCLFNQAFGLPKNIRTHLDLNLLKFKLSQRRISWNIKTEQHLLFVNLKSFKIND